MEHLFRICILRQTLLFLALSLVPASLSAGPGEKSASGNPRIMVLSASLYGDLELSDPPRWEPGLFFDLSLPIASNARNNPVHYRQFSFKPSLGFYQRKDFHTGILLWAQIGYKAIRRSGYFWEISAGPGYLQTIYNAPVYAQAEDGSFYRRRPVGEPHVVAGGELAAGWDFYRKRDFPFQVFISGGFYARYPNNQHWARHKFIKIGISYVFGRS